MTKPGRLIYLMNVSLDGYAAAPDGSLEWSLVDEEIHGWFNEVSRQMDASLYGRRLWEVMSAHWPTAEENPESSAVEREYARIWNAVPKLVFSTTLERVEHNARLVRGDVAEVLAQARQEFPGDLEVGGPTLAAEFIRRGLVDEYRLVIHPVILGGGLPFWPSLAEPIPVRLTDTHRFSSGAELRTYVPADGPRT